MLLKGELSTFERDDKYLTLLSSYPYWMVTNEAGKEILELCCISSSLEEVASRYAELADFSLEESLGIVEEFLGPLKEHGILGVDPDCEPCSPDPALIAVCINVTRDCNLRCPHCYASGGVHYDNELSENEVRQFLRDIRPYTKGPVQVQLTGGEPFLKVEKVFAAIDEFLNLHYDMLILNTNGILLTRDIVDRLEEAVRDVPYFNVTVSLDGATPETHEIIRGTGTFGKSVEALKILREAGLSVAASIAVHQGNFHELEAIFSLCMDLDVVPYTSPLAPLGRAPSSSLEPVNLSDLVKETYRIIRENNLPRDKMSATFLYYIVQALRNTNRRVYCGSGLSTLFLDSNGDLYPCMNTLFQDVFKCGNIRETPFGELWENSPVYRKMRSLNIPESTEKCKSCDVRYICAGYCRGLTYAETGDLYAPFIWCEDFRKALIQTMWILSEEPDLFQKQASAEFARYGIW